MYQFLSLGWFSSSFSKNSRIMKCYKSSLSCVYKKELSNCLEFLCGIWRDSNVLCNPLWLFAWLVKINRGLTMSFILACLHF
ncbi:hypothetical protein RchiOBHm_Chr2g0164511 [Rosa chinensis]|uniref:Uncharacterized protein n=1 Tax=Rosa chinensis TaxID=74649 RepID=A0A2P6S3L3_ROSCH|nr:hypothetical protein RchiOBHm_Chr2g0164511 [Rosa chinensis]